MKEIITIQVGQCGNQIGWRFWDLLQREHSMSHEGDSSLTTFFRPCEGATGSKAEAFLSPSSSTSSASANFISRHRARAVLIDMEEGVVSALQKSTLGGLFDSHMRLTDVSGAGNNWACGYASYGPQYSAGAIDLVRRSLEACESPQAFLLLHSLGGGTGSGFGSYLLEQLADNFPEQYRFTTSLMPSSKADDVITSPYNALLATARLIEHADAVLPIENQRLIDLVSAVTLQTKAAKKGSGTRTVTVPPSVLNLGSSNSNGGGGGASSKSSSSKVVRAVGAGGGGTKTRPSSENGSTSHDASSSSSSSSNSKIVAPTPPTAMPSALAKMLEQADAVLDSVAHGLTVTTSAADSKIPASKPAASTITTKTGLVVSGLRKPTPSSATTTSATTTTTTRGGISATAGVGKPPMKGATIIASRTSSITSKSTPTAAATAVGKTTTGVGMGGGGGVPRPGSSSRPSSSSSTNNNNKSTETPGVGMKSAATKLDASTPTSQRNLSSASASASSFKDGGDQLRQEGSGGGGGRRGGVRREQDEDDDDKLDKKERQRQNETHSLDQEMEQDDDEEEEEGEDDVVTTAPGKKRNGTPYDAMNTLVAHMLSNLTASMRFPGQMNVDINEITSTLVPFPQLHFLSTSLTPLLGGSSSTSSNGSSSSAALSSRNTDSRACERIIAQGFSNSNLLVDGDIRNGTHLACGILLRGGFAISDVNTMVQRQQRELNMVKWNSDGFKIGLCSSPPLYSDAAALCISNNCSIRIPLAAGYGRFLKLYRARAHIHHYLEYMPADEFQHAAEAVTNLISQYNF